MNNLSLTSLFTDVWPEWPVLLSSL